MNIHIKRKEYSVEEAEKIKYELIINKDYSIPIKYDWSLKGETADETLEDFHLFCISIVSDLFENKFKTNEEGKLIYDLHDFDSEPVLLDLEYLFSIVANKKIKK